MKEIITRLTRRKVAVVAPVLLALFMFAGGGIETRAQVENTPPQTPAGAQSELDAQQQPGNAPLGLLRVLNLTPEQRAQIGAIRRETEPQGRLLAMRLRQARRALDEAMYSEKPSDGVIEDRVREVGEAQAAVVRLRTLTELKIRRVLSPEQLNAFRRLQRQSRTRQRRNQTSPQGNLPEEGTPAERRRDRRQRRRQERQRQQQDEQPPLTGEPGAQPSSSAPPERRRAPLRATRPPR